MSDYHIRSTDPRVVINGRTFAASIQPTPLGDSRGPIFICGLFELTADYGWLTRHLINPNLRPGDIAATPDGAVGCAGAVAALARQWLADNPPGPLPPTDDLPPTGFADIDACVAEMAHINIA